MLHTSSASTATSYSQSRRVARVAKNLSPNTTALCARSMTKKARRRASIIATSVAFAKWAGANRLTTVMAATAATPYRSSLITNASRTCSSSAVEYALRILPSVEKVSYSLSALTTCTRAASINTWRTAWIVQFAGSRCLSRALLRSSMMPSSQNTSCQKITWMHVSTFTAKTAIKLQLHRSTSWVLNAQIVAPITLHETRASFSMLRTMRVKHVIRMINEPITMVLITEQMKVTRNPNKTDFKN